MNNYDGAIQTQQPFGEPPSILAWKYTLLVADTVNPNYYCESCGGEFIWPMYRAECISKRKQDIALDFCQTCMERLDDGPAGVIDELHNPKKPNAEPTYWPQFVEEATYNREFGVNG